MAQTLEEQRLSTARLIGIHSMVTIIVVGAWLPLNIVFLSTIKGDIHKAEAALMSGAVVAGWALVRIILLCRLAMRQSLQTVESAMPEDTVQ